MMRTLVWLSSIALTACEGAKEPPASANEVRVPAAAALPADPGDAAWRRAPVHAAGLILQDLVEPRLLAPSTQQVEVRALSDGKRIAFRLSWADPGKNDLPGAARFSDACAVQLPLRTEADVPAPQMGEPGKPVEIVYWSASAQAAADGRADDVSALYPNARVDHYPYEAAAIEKGSLEQLAMAKRYAPARAVGNLVALRGRPVQSLAAEGPGTLHPAEHQEADGRGAHDGKGWNVVLSRPVPANLAPGGRTQVAFAIWQGAKEEVGARKMRTGWIPILIERTP
jgi:hypothetical protein